jgi:hypothetical protein
MEHDRRFGTAAKFIIKITLKETFWVSIGDVKHCFNWSAARNS